MPAVVLAHIAPNMPNKCSAIAALVLIPKMAVETLPTKTTSAEPLTPVISVLTKSFKS